MHSLPPLNQWSETVWSLHQAAILIRLIHSALLARRKNALHLPLHVQPFGLSSSRLPKGVQLHVDFKRQHLIVEHPNQPSAEIPIADHTQATLFEALLANLCQDELSEYLADSTTATLAESLITRLGERNQAKLSTAEFTHTDPLSLNPQTAADYADVQYQAFTGIARFRARIEGAWTPAVVWPEHFDLSTLWFHPSNPQLDEHAAHLNFGFAPYTPNQYERPYLYVYAYPYPTDFEPRTVNVPAPAFWNTERWRGVVVNYADLNGDDIAQHVETLCLEIFHALLPVLNGE